MKHSKKIRAPLFKVTPQYETTYVFENDFPALLADTPSPEDTQDPLFRCLGRTKDEHSPEIRKLIDLLIQEPEDSAR